MTAPYRDGGGRPAEPHVFLREMPSYGAVEVTIFLWGRLASARVLPAFPADHDRLHAEINDVIWSALEAAGADPSLTFSGRQYLARKEA